MTSVAPRVMITAAASGIGATIATRFTAAGARVAVCDVNEAALAALTQQQPNISTATVDLSRVDEVTAWCRSVVENLGGVDVLINNAGIAGPTAFVEDVTYQEWQRTVAVGLNSHFLTCQQVVPAMKGQNSGSIINISSTAGLLGYGRRSPYAAAKWAVIGLTKSLAIELGPHNVRVNAICPGSVDGDRMQHVISNQAAARGVDADVIAVEYTEAQSIRRFVSPDEIADMCLFLASPASAMVSGQAIAVDGNTETYHL